MPWLTESLAEFCSCSWEQKRQHASRLAKRRAESFNPSQLRLAPNGSCTYPRCHFGKAIYFGNDLQNLSLARWIQINLLTLVEVLQTTLYYGLWRSNKAKLIISPWQGDKHALQTAVPEAVLEYFSGADQDIAEVRIVMGLGITSRVSHRFDRRPVEDISLAGESTRGFHRTFGAVGRRKRGAGHWDYMLTWQFLLSFLESLADVTHALVVT
ncbi:uncharacterized protein CTRU02_203920 [Colletotrichum truncatum]|uniref:Uncharacterized protein n=1 Tax=Colletotrichum truncatum TaxID=5467 RepID=A0ACC3ZAL1_COLTU|nr:uncharacterized protein CTRU02_04255 [Colletotrichum truncatum]KAF6796294.1 hypothetical protein CTRU02_04255 [Colletotrichum truncatum]